MSNPKGNIPKEILFPTSSKEEMISIKSIQEILYFFRHNSRRKSTLSCVSGIGGNPGGGDGQPLGFNLFSQPSPMMDPSKRRRSSSGSLLLSGQAHNTSRTPVTKSNSLSLPDDSPDA